MEKNAKEGVMEVVLDTNPETVVGIGSTVWWRGGWGTEPPRSALVEGLTITTEQREKYGTQVETTTLYSIFDNRCVLDLKIGGQYGHVWAYGSQIDGVVDHFILNETKTRTVAFVKDVTKEGASDGTDNV